jgi:predicted ATPase
MDYAIVLQRFYGNVPALAMRADELRDYAAQQKLHVHRGKAEFFTGWARAVSGGVDRGLNEMLTAIALVKGKDTPTDFPLYYEMLAEILGRSGRYAEALEAIGEAFAVAEAQGIVFWNAELHRRRGELLLAAGERDQAKASYIDAFRCARLQQARALELRAAMSLVRLQDVHDEHGAAESMLRACYECFDEGLETPDLVEARELLGPC